jgi:succinoglycan biosynthesis protein ExoA
VSSSQRLDPSTLVTVVVPARNEEHFIAGCLDAILAQDHPTLQVLVVDGMSEDRTVEIVAAYRARDARVECIPNPQQRVPSALNAGAAAARAEWMVRIDAHATVPPHYVRIAVENLLSGDYAAVGGRVDAVGVTPSGKAIAAAMNSPFGQGNSPHHYRTEPCDVDHIPFPAYPVALVRETGGWDERLPTHQDFEFDYRLHRNGHRLMYDPRLTISYHCRQRIRDAFRQYHRYAIGKTRVLVLHPESLSVRHLAAPALVGVLSLAGALVPRRPRWAAALVAPYALVVAAGSLATARRLPDTDGRMRLPLAFAAMHVGWGTGFWRGLLRLVRSRGRL